MELEKQISPNKDVKYNGNIPLEGNELFKELGFKIVFLFLLYLPFQILEEIKITFLKCLISLSVTIETLLKSDPNTLLFLLILL